MNDRAAEAARPPLRLVWSRPGSARRPPQRVNLATAIERHLSDRDGLTDEQFSRWYATGRAPLAVAE
jgi:hypothetical protein